jgi:hypothetical protein
MLGGQLQQRLDLGRSTNGEDFVLGSRHGAATPSNGNANVLPHRLIDKRNLCPGCSLDQPSVLLAKGA